MTEAEWLACTKTLLLLDRFRWDAAVTRKLRLFACACCERTQQCIADDRIERARMLLAQSAEEAVSEEQLHLAEQAIRAVASGEVIGTQMALFALFVANDKVHTQYYTLGVAAGAVNDVVLCRKDLKAKHVRKIEERRQVPILRDIFGNPFRPVSADPKWFTSTVVALAEGIYQERAFDRLPILADALQDAGCDNEVVLNHCRKPGEHVRGCWVLDLLTGRK